jgi:hypothetical protein
MQAPGMRTVNASVVIKAPGFIIVLFSGKPAAVHIRQRETIPRPLVFRQFAIAAQSLIDFKSAFHPLFCALKINPVAGADHVFSGDTFCQARSIAHGALGKILFRSFRSGFRLSKLRRGG